MSPLRREGASARPLTSVRLSLPRDSRRLSAAVRLGGVAGGERAASRQRIKAAFYDLPPANCDGHHRFTPEG